MKKQTKTSMKYFRSLGIALLVIGISIGAYGIFRAPSSDTSQLENELMQNERELEKEEATPAYAAAKTPAATKKQTAAPRVPDIHESSITVIGDTVIIALGTNGNFNSATGQKLIDYLGPDRTIYWIDAYGRDLPVQKDVNQTIRRVAAANQNVHVIAWSKEGGKHPGWFYQDGIHLNITGQKKFARFIKKNLITE